MKKRIKQYILILLIISMAVSATTFLSYAAADSYTNFPESGMGGSITIYNVDPNATVYYRHIIRSNKYNETGWEFYPAFSNSDWKYKESTLKCFVDAYGFNIADYGLTENSSYNDNADKFLALEQAVIWEVIKDYAESVGSNPPINGAANAGSANASQEFRQALQNIVNLGVGSKIINKTMSGRDDKGNPKATFDNNTSTMGVYILYPKSSSQEYFYNPTAAFVAFEYDDKTGLPFRNMDVTVKAKRISNIVNKTTSEDAKSLAVGDTTSYTITGLYPYFADQYHSTATYTISDSSGQLRDFKNIVVKVENTTLVAGKDYLLTTNSAPNGFVITMIDGNGSNNVANYKSEYAGKTVVVTYSATVASLTENGKVENTAIVTTRPDSSSDAWTTESIYVSDTYEYKLTKTNDYTDTVGKTDRHTLAGAQFDVKSGNKYVTFTTAEDDGVLYCTVSGTSNSPQTIEVPAGGVVFRGLDYDKTYVVTEVKAPAGYSLSTTSITISANIMGLTQQTVTQQAKVNGVDTTTVTNKIVMSNDTSKEAGITELAADFKNTKLLNLPSTGGTGTYVLTLVGAAVMATAVVIFCGQRKSEAEA